MVAQFRAAIPLSPRESKPVETAGKKKPFLHILAPAATMAIQTIRPKLLEIRYLF